MIQVHCDRPGCATTALCDATGYNTPPKGWVSVRVQHEYPAHDYCSLHCAATALLEREAVIADADPVPPAGA